jgi:PPM family protein phosphatase
VLFRLAEGGGVGSDGDEETTIAGTLKAADVRAAADTRAPGATAIRRAERAPARPRRRTRAPGRALLGGLAALVVMAAVVAGLYALSRQVYFVGTNDAGLVTLYRGVPYELPFGLELYEEQYASGIPARAIPASRRGRVLDHDWRSRDDATDLVRTLERGELEGGPTGGLRAGRAET